MSTTKISIELGDIIKINSPNNTDVHHKIFLVKYLDNNVLELIHHKTLKILHFPLANGNLRDESIVSISILSKAPDKGYAKQNNLLPNNWIDIHIKGDIPTIIVGQINSLEEDMIEIETYPEKLKIFIDFAYKGLPKNPPFASITLRNKPEQLIKEDKSEETPDQIPDRTLQEQLTEIILEEDDLVFGEEGEIDIIVEVPESEKVYSLKAQTNDLLDDLLAHINKNNTKAINNIHLMVERFKQLRTTFSAFNTYGSIQAIQRHSDIHTPLIHELFHLNKTIPWMIPISKNTKKVFDTDADADDDYDVIAAPQTDLLYKINEQSEKYNQNDTTQNKYDYFIRNLTNLFIPFQEPLSSLNTIATKPVQTNITTIVDNQDDLYSSIVINKGEGGVVQKKRFSQLVYTKGLQRLLTENIRGARMKIEHIPLTPNERLTIKGFIQFPYNIFKYSKIYSPSTSILHKAQLNLANFTYSALLRKNTEVVTLTVDDLENPIPYSNKSTNEFNFLKHTKEILLSDRLMQEENADKYLQFIQTITPNPTQLFKHIQDNIQRHTSLLNIVKHLEPFMIFENDVNLSLYREIKQFIQKNITHHKKTLLASRRQYNIFQNFTYKHTFSGSSLLTLKELQPYNINNGTSSEILTHILTIDNGKTFFDFLALENIDLFSLQNIDEEIKKHILQKEKTPEEEKCKNLTIAKQYIDLEALKEDNNNKNTFFDKKYDTTHYSILEEYKTDIEGLKPQAAQTFLIEQLTTTAGLDTTYAEEEAAALIEGKRKVKDGHYSFIQEDDTGKIHYYKREREKWVHAPSLANTQPGFFCNMKNKCLEVKGHCKDTADETNYLDKTRLENILKHFNTKYHLSKNDLSEKLEQLLQKNKSKLAFLHNIHQINRFKYNIKKKQIGYTLKDINIPISPRANVRNRILTIPDIAKKFDSVKKFVNHYCREPSDDENQFWFYCHETSTPLLPVFFKILADAFHNGTYPTELARISSTQGELSDDGEAIVDKHSGYIIRYIDFDVAEGYDEVGFKIVTHEVLKKTARDIILPEPTKVYKMKDAQTISNIFHTISELMGLSIQSEEENIIRFVIDILKKKVPRKAKYLKLLAAAKKKKKLPTYDEFYDDALLTYTICYILITTQTIMPSIITKKTYPGCKRSFSGFPLGDEDDQSTIHYFACVIVNLSSETRPWNTLRKYIGKKGHKKEKTAKLAKKINTFIQKKLITIPEVMNKILEKRAYIVTHEDQSNIPKEHDVIHWTTFLPPLFLPKIPKQQNVSDTFDDSLQRDIKTGSNEQFEKLSILQSKIYFYSLAIQGYIQKILDQEDPLLLTASQEPYIQNVCCNKDTNHSAIHFFTSKNNAILSTNKIVRHLSNIFHNSINIAPTILNTTDTKLKYPIIHSEFSEQTIYQAFIHFCKFNSGIPLSDELQEICTTNSANFSNFDPLEEKIKILKEEGRMFDIQNLNALLLKVSITITRSHELTVTPLASLKQNETLLEDFEELKKFTETIEENGTIKTDVEFRNFILGKTRELREKTLEYLNTNAGMKRPEKRTIEEFLHHFSDWKERGNELYMNKQDETFYTARSFAIQAIQNICNIYPSIILNETNHVNVALTKKIPKHWKLSSIHQGHMKKIVDEEFSPLFPFFHTPEFDTILPKIQKSSLSLLSQNIPFHTNEDKKNLAFDGTLNKELLEYMFYLGLNLYIDESESFSGLEERKRETDSFVTTDSVTETTYGKSLSTEILEGQREELNQKTSRLLVQYLLMLHKKKTAIDKNNSEINEHILKSKEKEKNIITKELQDLTIEQREIENLMKSHRLGKWGVGQTKALFIYDKEQYNREIKELERITEMEAKLSKFDDVTALNREIYSDLIAYEQDMDQQQQQEYGAAMAGISGDDDMGDPEGESAF